MTVSLLHAKISGKAAGSDPTRIYGTHWDAQHTLTGTPNSFIVFNSLGNAIAWQKNVRVVTTVNLAILATDTVVVINKGSPSATVITMCSVYDYDPNGELEIYDWAGNAGDMSFIASGSEQFMGSTNPWKVGSGGGVQTGGSIKIRPCVALNGWLIR